MPVRKIVSGFANAFADRQTGLPVAKVISRPGSLNWSDGEQRRAQDGQDRVLVARRRDGAGEGLAAVDDEIGHRTR